MTTNDVMKLTTALAKATECASCMASKALGVFDAVAGVTEQASECISKLVNEGSFDASMEAEDFRQAMTMLQESGEDIQLSCLDLKAKWVSYSAFISDAFKQQTVSKQKISMSKKLLQQVLTLAADCGQRFEEFKEKLKNAMSTGMTLEERSKQAEMKGDSSSKDYSALSALQSFGVAAAHSFLSLVMKDRTAGAEQGNHASGIDKQTQEFCDLRAQLNTWVDNLDKLGESTIELVDLTKEMAQGIEHAINIFIEQEKLRIKESELQFEQERMLHEAEELERKMQKMLDDRKMEETAVGGANESAAERIPLTTAGMASQLIKLLNNLITASGFARNLAQGVDSTGEMAAVIRELESCQLGLKGSNVALNESVEFCKAIHEIRAPFEALMKPLSDLSDKWELFQSSTIGILELKHLTQKQVRDCIQQLKLLLDCSKICTSLHQEFKKKSQHPIVAGTHLVQRCRAAANASRSKTSKVPIGVAAFAVMTTVADADSSKMERIATDLANLVEKMSGLLQRLRDLEDSLAAFVGVARKILRNTEALLELFRKPVRNKKSKMESDEAKKLDERALRFNEELEKLLGELANARQSRRY